MSIKRRKRALSNISNVEHTTYEQARDKLYNQIKLNGVLPDDYLKTIKDLSYDETISLAESFIKDGFEDTIFYTLMDKLFKKAFSIDNNIKALYKLGINAARTNGLEAEKIFDKINAASNKSSPHNLQFYRIYISIILQNGNINKAKDILFELMEKGPKETNDPDYKKICQYHDYITEAKSINQDLKYNVIAEKNESNTDLEKLCDNNLFNVAYTSKEKLCVDSIIITAGSCFSANMCRVLKENEITSGNITFNHTTNTTYHIRKYFDIATSNDSTISKNDEIIKMFGSNPRDNIKTFQNSNAFIFNIDSNTCFFNKDDGQYTHIDGDKHALEKASNRLEFRNITIEENKQNIIEIVKNIKIINPNAKIFFSVSPVPTNITTADKSVYIEDCLSKSILRVAINEALKEINDINIMYWPFFEFFKWLADYSKEPLFGKEDGSPLHVSRFAIKIAVDCFVNKVIEK